MFADEYRITEIFRSLQLLVVGIVAEQEREHRVGNQSLLAQIEQDMAYHLVAVFDIDKIQVARRGLPPGLIDEIKPVDIGLELFEPFPEIIIVFFQVKLLERHATRVEDIYFDVKLIQVIEIFTSDLLFDDEF